MRVIIQRVSKSSVSINGHQHAGIKNGFTLLLGIGQTDEKEDAEWLASKVINLRVFEDDAQKMNLSIREIDGEILVISQFTLFASYKKGNRPSFLGSAAPEKAIPLYEYFIKLLENELPGKIKSGVFATMMEVNITNHGPVTIHMDSKNRE